jgi:hypothetical protein
MKQLTLACAKGQEDVKVKRVRERMSGDVGLYSCLKTSILSALAALRDKRSNLEALVIDPALHSMGGHHYVAMERLLAELDALGLKRRALGSRYADRRVTMALGVKPSFQHSIYGREKWTNIEFQEHVEDTEATLSHRVGRLARRPALVILPCCDQVLAAALAACIRSYRGWRPYVLLWLLFPPETNARVTSSYPMTSLNEYREAFAGLQASLQGASRLAIFCETDELAQRYRDLLNVTVGVTPGPNLVSGKPVAPRRARSGPLTVSCVGYANGPKGYKLLPQAIQGVLQARSDVRFLIHGARATRREFRRCALSDASNTRPSGLRL